MIDKTVASAQHAIGDVASGSSLAVGGFGMCGVPTALIDALRASGADDLEIVSNNCGADNWGLALLLGDNRIRRVVASYFGDNREFANQYLSGRIEVEITPQGTLAERLRAAAAGIAGFYTPTGAGTVVADGGLPWLYNADGSVQKASPRKEQRVFTTFGYENDYVLEHALPTDFALVRAAVGDRHGNLAFHATARNFNPLCAMAAKVTIAEVERLVEPGELDPDAIHLPGIFVDRIVELTPDQVAAKSVEKVRIRPRTEEAQR
ncbi:MAG: CoA transferase subunit A [Rhodococcus sp. (in: high G+C Gram-positive bacteria)]